MEKEFPRRFMRLSEVMRIVGYSRTSIYLKIQNNEFPAPYKLSKDGRAVAWASDEIQAWIESRAK